MNNMPLVANINETFVKAGVILSIVITASLVGIYLAKRSATKKKEERNARLRACAGSVLTSQMPGKILQVKVNAGDTVEKGQPLFLVDSCKMEFEIPSTVSGMVKEIITPVGSSVEKGDIMVLFY